MADFLLLGHSQIFKNDGLTWFGRTIGPYKIRKVAEENGLTVKLIDFCDAYSDVETTAFIDKYITADTKMLGVSATYTFFGDVSKKINRAFFEKVKAKNPNIVIVIGGQNDKVQSFFHESCGDYIDWSLTGYAEQGFDVLLKYLFHSGPMPTFNLINSVKVIECNKFYLDKFNFYKYSWKDSDLIDNSQTLPIEIGRGCIFDCAFCGFALRGKRANELIVAENDIYDAMMRNYENFGTTKYTFIDETYNDSVEKLEAVTRVVDRLPFDIQFTAYIKPDLLARYPVMLDHLKYQGLVACSSGIETLNTQTRKSIFKGISREKIIEILTLMQEKFNYELQIRISLIVGLPYDTPSMLFDTHDWLMANKQLVKCWDWYALNINDNPNMANKISANFSSFGYTIPDPNYVAYWINSTNGMDFTLASQLAFILNTLKNEALVGRFLMCGSDLGPTIEELRQNPYLSNFDMNRAKQIFDKFITDYKQSRHYAD